MEHFQASTLTICVLLFAGQLAGQDPNPTPESPPSTEQPRQPPRKEPSPLQLELYSPLNDLERRLDYAIDGTLSARYIFRSSPGERDQDLYENLHLRLGNPERDQISAVFLGRLSEDIDGQRHRDGFSVFDNVTDSYDNNVNGRFYLGYLELRRMQWLDTAGIDRVRAGRQTYDETADFLIFDGGRIDSRAFKDLANLRLTAYGGLPVHYFESSPSGDALAGAGMELAPFRSTRGRVDWTYLEDRREDIHASDHLLSAALWQSLGERFSLHGRYNLLNGDTRDYLVRGTYRETLIDFLLQASFRHSVQPLRDLSVELDPFFSVVRDYKPFWQVDVRGSKGLGEHASLDGGISLRELVHEEDQGRFNHEFVRYYVTPSTHDWPFKGTSVSLTGELWQSQGDQFFTLGGEVRQAILRALILAIGSQYSLYKYDFFSQEEKSHVRTIFGRLEYRLATDVKVHVLYSCEKDDVSTYHILETGLTYSF